MHRTLAKLYNRLVHYYPEQAGAVGSDSYTRNVLGNRLAAGDVRWLNAEGMLEWEPGCIGWLTGWATCRATLESLTPFVERAAAVFPGMSWCGGIPGQLAMLGVDELCALTSALIRLGSTPEDDPGIVDILTALHLVVGWRDGTEIPYLPARRIAEQQGLEAEFLLSNHRWATPKSEMNWELLRVAVLGPEELRLEAADAWAGDWEWRSGVLLGLELMPKGPYLRKARHFSYEHSGRAVAWGRRLGEIHWFEPEFAPGILLELETGYSANAERMIAYCVEHGWVPELRELAAQWLVFEAQQRFKALLSQFEPAEKKVERDGAQARFFRLTTC